MALFRPYERTNKDERKSTSTVPESSGKYAESSSEAPKPTSDTASSEKIVVHRREKKGPTPKRREAEAARMERLHPTLSPKEQRKRDREAKYEAQAATWEKIESSPERVLLRDFVDARWTAAEFMMPAMILIMALMMATMSNPALSSYIALLLWVVLIIAGIQLWFMWRSYKKLLAERVPNASKRGLLMYMINRAMMIRRFRRPAPRNNRGDDV